PTTLTLFPYPTLFRSEGPNLPACYFSAPCLATDMIKLVRPAVFLGICFSLSARADLTITQKVEGAGPSTEMTIKIKGDKARIDRSEEHTSELQSRFDL